MFGLKAKKGKIKEEKLIKEINELVNELKSYPLTGEETNNVINIMQFPSLKGEAYLVLLRNKYRYPKNKISKKSLEEEVQEVLEFLKINMNKATEKEIFLIKKYLKLTPKEILKNKKILYKTYELRAKLI